MSFYITIKEALIEERKHHRRQSHAIVITSENNRLITFFSEEESRKIKWNDALVAESSEVELEFMLVQEKVPGKTAQKMSSNVIGLSKYLFWSSKENKDEIPLYDANGRYTDTLIIEVCYRENKYFIGPIEFYRRGSDHVTNEDGENLIEIEGDKSKFSFWRLIGRDRHPDGESDDSGSQPHKGNHKGDRESSQTGGKSLLGFLGFGGKKSREDSPERDKQVNGEDSKHKKGENVKFYKGAHKNRNFFSMCDQVHDDQKFTVVQNYYDDESSSQN